MRNIILTVIATLFLSAALTAQTLNWAAFQPEQKQLVHLQAGWDYSLSSGVGIGYKFNGLFPVLANVEYSFPAGKTLFDDFKVRVGGQVKLLEYHHFILTGKAYCPIRRYENSLASMFSFGSEFSGILGYYRRHWFLGAEFGFDKAIVTHVKNSDLAHDVYPDIQDGWYIPTAGVYTFDLQTGVSFRSLDITLKAGSRVNQGFGNAPFIPYYAQLGLGWRF